jgi:hypothetical protein
MVTLSEGLGFEKITTLAEAVPVDVPDQKTIKQTPDVERVPLEELELAYLRHPIVFNAVNKSVQAIMSAGWELRAKDQKVYDYFKNFIDNVGKVGEKVTFDEILESLFQYQMIYGNTQLETVLGKFTDDPNNIVDLVILDPKRMDYAKTSDGKIALDKYCMPLGFVQQWPFEIDTSTNGDPIPEGSEVSLGTNQIFLLPKRICLFKLYTFGDRFYSMGLAEAAYKSILYELSIKKAHYNSIEQKGEPPLIDYVGDQFHQPTPQQIQNSVETMKKFKFNRYFAFPYWHRVEPVNYKPNDIIIDSLKYLREDISSAIGMPLSFAIGSGEDTNRSTLSTQHLFLAFTLNNIVKKTMAVLKKEVFARISSFNKFDEVPEIVWNHIGVEEINEKAKRLVDYVKVGALDPKDEGLLDYIKQSERLKKYKDTTQNGE